MRELLPEGAERGVTAEAGVADGEGGAEAGRRSSAPAGRHDSGQAHGEQRPAAWIVGDECAGIRQHQPGQQYLDGMAAAASGDARGPDAAEALDAWQRRGFAANWVFPESLAAGRLWAALGRWDRASAALERRSPALVRYLPMTLRLAGEAAARSGHPQLAIRAYRHYLALRTHAESGLQAEVNRVRAALASLESVAVTH